MIPEAVARLSRLTPIPIPTTINDQWIVKFRELALPRRLPPTLKHLLAEYLKIGKTTQGTTGQGLTESAKPESELASRKVLPQTTSLLRLPTGDSIHF